jgi:Ca2+/Na+ antiporter
MLSIITTALSVFAMVIVSLMLWFYFKSFFIGLWYIFLAYVVVCLIIGAVKEFNAGRSAKDKEKQEQEQDL